MPLFPAAPVSINQWGSPLYEGEGADIWIAFITVLIEMAPTGSDCDEVGRPRLVLRRYASARWRARSLGGLTDPLNVCGTNGEDKNWPESEVGHYIKGRCSSVEECDIRRMC